MGHLIDVAALLYYPWDKRVRNMQDKQMEPARASLAQA